MARFFRRLRKIVVLERLNCSHFLHPSSSSLRTHLGCRKWVSRIGFCGDKKDLRVFVISEKMEFYSSRKERFAGGEMCSVCKGFA